jgi:endonuclease/exonuclease/phosphatase family metal-dependent hydrolase
MRLICLNTFCGKVREPLLEFLRAEAAQTDIFCLQETWRNNNAINNGRRDLLTTIQEILPDFDLYFAPILFDLNFVEEANIDMGQAMLVRKNIKVIKHGQVTVNPGYGPEPEWAPGMRREMQFGKIEVADKTLNVFNLHGISRWPKTDSWEREAQSWIVRNLMDKFTGPKILCGDFNLQPDTESVAVLKKGMRSLTDDYGIKTTRGRYRQFDEHISDYMIVSPEIKVLDFQVPDIIISDHLPLILDFEL